MKKRIWELDALRGLCILCMIAVHLMYNLTDLFQVVRLDQAGLYNFLLEWGGVVFLVLSGLCVTLGSHSIRRGLMVLGSGLLITAVTVGMYLLDAADSSMIIYFGILHCLGICMLLWPLFKAWHPLLLAGVGTVLCVIGLLIWDRVWVDFPWLIGLGLVPTWFASADYFPLLPNLGFFLLGAALGRTLYKEKRSLLPKVNEKYFPINFLCFCGRQSLLIYLLHQPVLTGILYLILPLLQEA